MLLKCAVYINKADKFVERNKRLFRNILRSNIGFCTFDSMTTNNIRNIRERKGRIISGIEIKILDQRWKFPKRGRYICSI